jgi:ketosteroid isomerase-like protein
MTEAEDIALLRGAYADWAQGDFTRPEMFHPDVEFVTDFPEHVTYRGLDGLQRGWFDFLAAWEGLKVRLEDVIPAGDGRYLVLVHLTGRGRSSHAPAESDGANVVTVRDGKIARLTIVWDRGQAFAEAGLDPSG